MLKSTQIYKRKLLDMRIVFSISDAYEFSYYKKPQLVWKKDIVQPKFVLKLSNLQDI